MLESYNLEMAKNTARDQKKFYENQGKKDMLEPTCFKSDISGMIVGCDSCTQAYEAGYTELNRAYGLLWLFG